MNKYKSGFTLVELMVVLSIFSIAIGLIFGVFSQGYKMFNRINNYSIIEDEFRNTVMNIESIIENDIEKNVIVYNNKSGIYVDSEDYNESDQEALMCVIPKEDEDKTIYIKAKSKQGNIQLLQVEFSNSTNNDSLVKETVKDVVAITPKSIKVLINNLDESSEIIFNKENEIINLTIKGNTIRNNYTSSFLNKKNQDINIILSNTTTETPTKPENGEIEKNKIEEFIDSLKFSINITGNLNFQSASEKCIVYGGSIGYGGEFGEGGFTNTSTVNVVNEKLSMIGLDVNPKGNIIINEGSNSINGSYLSYNSSNNKYKIILVDGDITIGTGDDNGDINLENVIIISTGSIVFSNNKIKFNMKNSTIYGRDIQFNNNQVCYIEGNTQNIIQEIRADLVNILGKYIRTVDIEFNIEEVWGDDSKYSITIKNNMVKDIKSWQIIFDSELQIKESWHANFNNTISKQYSFTNMNYNGIIHSGQSIKIEGKCSSGTQKVKNIVVRFTE